MFEQTYKMSPQSACQSRAHRTQQNDRVQRTIIDALRVFVCVCTRSTHYYWVVVAVVAVVSPNPVIIILMHSLRTQPHQRDRRIRLAGWLAVVVAFALIEYYSIWGRHTSSEKATQSNPLDDERRASKQAIHARILHCLYACIILLAYTVRIAYHNQTT